MDRPYNILFLCTGNSARSILAETVANRLGEGRFKAYSAGSFPTGRVNPFAITLLDSIGVPTAGLRSKSWDEFAGPDGPTLDFVITVCDNAAGEVCPIWLGHPVQSHWGLPDPAAVEGSDDEKLHAFLATYATLSERLEAFTALPLEQMAPSEIKRKMDLIGKADDTPETT